MLTSLRLRNFKSWRDTGPVELVPITAFFGTNSSGKTSILQSLLLLRQTTQSPDSRRVLDLNGRLVDLGTFDDLLFGHDRGAKMSFRLTWADEDPLYVADQIQAPSPRLASQVAISGSR